MPVIPGAGPVPDRFEPVVKSVTRNLRIDKTAIITLDQTMLARRHAAIDEDRKVTGQVPAWQTVKRREFGYGPVRQAPCERVIFLHNHLLQAWDLFPIL